MRRTFRGGLSGLVLALLILFPVPTLLAQDWVGRGRAHGQVVDSQGNPIEGAEVTLHLPDRPEAGPDPVITGKDGRWAFGGLDGQTWKVVIEKEGYMTSEGTLKVNEFSPARAVQVELEENPFAAVREGQELVDQGRYAEAREKFQEVLPKMEERQQAQVRTLIGTTHYQQGSYEAAIEAYEQALPGLSPEEQTSTRLRLGDAYLQLGDHQRARSTYEAALGTLGADGRKQVLMAIARSYDLEDDREMAIETVQRILEQNPDDVQALQLIADLLGREGRQEEAQEYLDRIPENQELPPDMLLNQGIRFFNEQKLDRALENFDRVIRQDPDTADAYYYRGLAYLNQGNNDLAKADFQKLLELDPDHPNTAEVEEFLEYLESQ